MSILLRQTQRVSSLLVTVLDHGNGNRLQDECLVCPRGFMHGCGLLLPEIVHIFVELRIDFGAGSAVVMACNTLLTQLLALLGSDAIQ